MLHMIPTPVGVECGTLNFTTGSSLVPRLCCVRTEDCCQYPPGISGVMIFALQRPGSFFSLRFLELSEGFSPFAFVVWTVGAAKCFGHSAASMEY